MHKIEYLRVILTEKCNLKCFFCHKEGIDKYKESSIKYDELKQCLQLLCDSGIRKIKFMGGEPTLYPELQKIIAWLREDKKNLDLSIISNGIVERKIFEEYIASGIDRINISMHGFDEKVFSSVTRGSVNQLLQSLDNIKYLKSCGKLGKVNYVLLKGINEDEFYKVLEFINKESLVLDVLNYLGTKEDEIEKYRYSFEEIVLLINKKYRISHSIKYTNPYSLDSQRLILQEGGIINLKVNPLSEADFLKACRTCSQKKLCIEGISAIRLTSDGVIKPCLFRDDLTYDLLSSLKTKTMDKVLENVQEYFDKL